MNLTKRLQSFLNRNSKHIETEFATYEYFEIYKPSHLTRIFLIFS